MAVSLAADLNQALGVESTLIPGSGGIFDVAIDGAVIYSKHQTGQYPDPDELISAIQCRRNLHSESVEARRTP